MIKGAPEREVTHWHKQWFPSCFSVFPFLSYQNNVVQWDWGFNYKIRCPTHIFHSHYNRKTKFFFLQVENTVLALFHSSDNFGTHLSSSTLSSSLREQQQDDRWGFSVHKSKICHLKFSWYKIELIFLKSVKRKISFFFNEVYNLG